ncbi:unnamed protein product [Aureobasidium uvarum]|uniref:Uncharacterized protein n=1 Tax=Aureobasidium uvarum TaxID=2773716 RepID=A0A9N8PR88_9PEZI|nr:unnamed protein product [Aureobasidium uvarum]
MSRPAPIDTQSSAIKRAAGRVVSFLTPKKDKFSPTSPENSQKPLPPFEPQRLLEAGRERHDLPQRPLQREPSRHSLRPSVSRSSLRPDMYSHSRAGSRDTRDHRDRSASRGSVISHTRSASRMSMRSFDSRWTRDEPYRDPDNREFKLKRDAEPKEIDGITHWWTNLYLEGKFLGHFFCRQEPRFKPDCFFPGMIIWATHAFFQNNLNATPGDPRIALTRHAPVYVKPRPMVVLYSTDSGLCCAPMFSLDNKNQWHRRKYEYIAITKEGDDWQGETDWAGVLTFRPHP